MSEACAKRLATADNDTDNYLEMFNNTSPMYFIGDFSYHFDTSPDGKSVVPGARDATISAEEIKADQFFQRGAFRNVLSGIDHLGKALHALQDKFSHNSEHFAATPADHAPRPFCVFMGDPDGTKISWCMDARERNPNWYDPHLPDQPWRWYSDVNRTCDASKVKVKSWLKRWTVLQCACQ